MALFRRETTGDWKRYLPAGEGSAEEPVFRDDGHRACTFLDKDRAWVVGLAGEMPDRKIMIYRTTDGGVTWSSSGLGDDRYTDWPVAPLADLVFGDPLNGRLTTIDPPVHHNGHVRTIVSYSTTDGGRTWRRTGVRRQSSSD